MDLSQEISPDLQVFPAYPRPILIPWTRREVHGFLSEALFLVSHTGTHVDAPWHYRPEGKKLHELAVDRFVRPAHVLDLQVRRNRGRITANRLEQAVRHDGVNIQRENAVLLRTDGKRNGERRPICTKTQGSRKGAPSGWCARGQASSASTRPALIFPTRGTFPPTTRSWQRISPFSKT